MDKKFAHTQLAIYKKYKSYFEYKITYKSDQIDVKVL